MFDPKFCISNRLLSLVVKAEVDFFYVKSVTIPEDWLVKLKSDVLVRRIVYGLKLEGIEVASDVVAKIVLDDPGRDEKLADIAARNNLIIKEDEMQAIMNMINAIKLTSQIGFIVSKFAGEKLETKDLIKINKMVGERLSPASSLGFLRSSDILIGTIKHPYSNEVEYQLEDFMNWFNSETVKEISPLLVFMISLAELVRMWPFEKYSFLTIVLFVECFLASRSYVGVDLSSIEEEIWRKKQRFFDLLSKQQSGVEVDVEILEFGVEILASVAAKAKTRLGEIGQLPFKIVTNQGRPVALSERQILILEEVSSKGQLTIKEIREILPNLSDDTILRELKDLLGKKMIRRRGKTKGAIYLPTKVK